MLILCKLVDILGWVRLQEALVQSAKEVGLCYFACYWQTNRHFEAILDAILDFLETILDQCSSEQQAWLKVFRLLNVSLVCYIDCEIVGWLEEASAQSTKMKEVGWCYLAG